MTDRPAPSPGSSVWLLFCLLMILSSVVRAHELRPTVADIVVTADTIEVSMRVNLEALITEIGPEHNDSDNAPQAQHYNRLREMSPEDLQLEFMDYFDEFIAKAVLNDNTGTPLPLNFGSLSIPPVADTRLPRDSLLVLEVPREAGTTSVSWQWSPQYGAIIVRADVPKSIDPSVSDRSFSQFVQPGESSDQIAIDVSSGYSAGSTFLDYIVIGYEHIIPKGLDHILFVIGLFLLAPRFTPIAWQVSMFTIAHTVTLALGITGIIALPASIVEPLIALSITIICVENLFGNRFGKSRLAIVFTFGLLHGLGFAGVLSDIGLTTDRFISSLIAFNIGVELGQLSVVLLCFLLVGWWLGKKSWYDSAITRPASLIIGAIGLFWFLQRLGIIA